MEDKDLVTKGLTEQSVLSEMPQSEESPQESVQTQEPVQPQEPVPIATSDVEPNPDPSIKNQNNGIVLKKSHLIIGVAVALALMVGGFFLGYFLKNGNDALLTDQDEVYSQVDPMKPDPNAKPYGDVQAFPENPTPGNIIMPGYSELRMHSDTNLLKAIWINSEGNSCYLRFTLRLSDTGETLYQSGLIAPGMAVEESLLSRTLSRGEYEAEIMIEAFTMDNEPSPLNSMKVVAVKLYVL